MKPSYDEPTRTCQRRIASRTGAPHPPRRFVARIEDEQPVDPLLQWCTDSRSDVRAAALGALGSIGLDNRSYDVALRALGDADPQARAMAARAGLAALQARAREEGQAGDLARQMLWSRPPIAAHA